MAGFGLKRWWVGLGLMMRRRVLVGFIVVACLFLVAEPRLEQEMSSLSESSNEEIVVESGYLNKLWSLMWENGKVGYEHVWPEMKLNWKIVVGSIIGFFGAAFGSVGGVGGGGIFVPMLTLIIGFDAKSSTAISKCMITGAAAATVYYNLKLRHPTLDMPIIDYDLALLFQPMLVLGISVGVALNVILADWMITILLIILFIGSSTKAFFKGVETWKKETIIKKETARMMESDNGTEDMAYRPLPGGYANGRQTYMLESRKEVYILDNVYWKELGILFAVWIAILALQIAKVPVAVGVTSYEAVSLYKGRRTIASKGDAGTNWKVHQLILYSICGLLAGIVGGLLGLGGGFILGPLFLELGIPPQVSSATATFAMTFSASMSVIEYYLLKRFPVPQALYFVAVATIAAFVGQFVVRKIISILGRASLIIFILSFTIFVSAISLGGEGIVEMIEKIERKEYMGFDNLCTYSS
ncbi:hypothetical protein EZV62_003986 [Acer yangbiense]|uniref:Sulfite exporter TauE/SafE family protein 3-like n=1 Tax=Acer yangbiense TaxID=1000413 RepID=A0A5C7IIT5_9ROSI|nr:hypothetical protein EZV62_003986 [Acer yangbiense]